MGPGLVQHLRGSDYAKERLEVILETIAGNLPVAEACHRLGIGEAMFHRLRMRVLQVGLSDLEPRTAGRPRREMSETEREKQQLSAKVDALEDELKLAEVRHELAMILPEMDPSSQSSNDAAPKKTTGNKKKRVGRGTRKRKQRPR